MICKDCPNCVLIANSEETGSAICKYPMSYMPIELNQECVFAPKPYTCKDCDRFANDMACMTAEEDDLVEKENGMCWGFIDKNESLMYNILHDWKMRGFNIEEKLDDVLKDFNENFKSPWEE